MRYLGERLVGDPLPFRHGEWFGGGLAVLTRGEFKAVEWILDHIECVRPATVQDDPDRWTAFVSLLSGGYIRETHPDNGRYVLMDKGVAYKRQLREDK